MAGETLFAEDPLAPRMHVAGVADRAAEHINALVDNVAKQSERNLLPRLARDAEPRCRTCSKINSQGMFIRAAAEISGCSIANR